MNVVAKFTTAIGIFLIMGFVIFPRMLMHWGLEHEYINLLVDPVSTFLIAFVAVLLPIMGILGRRVIGIPIALIIASVIAWFMTSFWVTV